MKIWIGHGTEHSANLLMIGTFKEIRDAEVTKKAIDLLCQEVNQDHERYSYGRNTEFSDQIMKIMNEYRFYGLSPEELEQFCLDVQTTQKDKTIILETDETDISAFFKLFIDRGARIEIYSRHDYPDSI